MIVQEILKGKDGIVGVLTLTPGDKVTTAAELMSKHRVGTIVISEDGESPDGILSERDIVRELGRSGARCLDQSVRDVMTPNPVTCKLGDEGQRIVETMTHKRFRHMPVMDGDRMIGLISIGDVVKARLAELGMERDALEGMIRGA